MNRTVRHNERSRKTIRLALLGALAWAVWHRTTSDNRRGALTADGLQDLADLGSKWAASRSLAYQGVGATVRASYGNHREQPAHHQRFNHDHARLRAPGERAFVQSNSWRLLRRARCATRRIGTIVQAGHTPMTCSCSR